MRVFTADLHLHSVLSPCGDLEMSPAAVLARAREVGLDLIALTDHNMVENGTALQALAEGSGISLLYGMEMETAEEVHVLCLFDGLTEALALQETVYAHLPAIPNDPERFGYQVVVDAEENVLRFEERLLVNATDIPLADAVSLVERRGGLAIPSHVDRPVHSLVSQLGFPPADLPLAAVELSRFAGPAFLEENDSWIERVPIVRFSDAHFLGEIGKQRTLFRMEAPTVAELRLALSGTAGRAIEGYQQD